MEYSLFSCTKGRSMTPYANTTAEQTKQRTTKNAASVPATCGRRVPYSAHSLVPSCME